MALQNGYYAPEVAKKVTHWPLPDKNGDGEQAWEDLVDDQGNNMGRQAAKDAAGNEVYHYEPPEGFLNRPSYDGTPNHVKVDSRGRVWRHPVTGEAVGITPGTTLVEHANGDFYHLRDDYARYLFEKSHRPAEAPVDTAAVEAPKTDRQKQAEADAVLREEFDAWKAAQPKVTP